MRKTIMLGTLIALFGIGALAQAKDVTTTEQNSSTEASRPDAPAVRGEESKNERRSASREARRETQDDGREHHDDEASERHDENREHGRRH